MTRHLGDELHDFVLGALPASEQAELEAHVASCQHCAALTAEATESFAALALAVVPLAPPSGARDRLLLAATGSSRFASLLDAVGKFFDVATDRAAKLLDSVDVAASWEAGPFENLRLIHLDAGPAYQGSDAGFIRIAAGTQFPRHTHLGEERALFLQGTVRESDGTLLGPGDLRVMPQGSAHSFQVLDGPDLIYALVLCTGVEFAPPPK